MHSQPVSAQARLFLALWPDPTAQAELGLALKRLGLPTKDRVFRPHLTLSRRAGGSEAPTRVLDLGWTVQDYSLGESTGDPLQRYRQIEHLGHSRIIRPNP